MSRKRKGPRVPRVIRQFHEQLDAAEPIYLQAPLVSAGGVELRRLSFWEDEPRPFDAERIARTVIDRPAVRYFADSSLFIGHTEQCLWEALRSTESLVITPTLIQELAQWRQRPKKNEGVHGYFEDALSGKPSPMQLLPQLNPVDEVVCNYYVNLLGMRKRGAIAARAKLEERLGREPTDDEVSNYCQQVGTSRMQLLAKQGAAPKVTEHLFNDEQLVVLAVLDALRSGVETMILTADEAVLDQFCKLTYLLAAHFRSFHLARRYAADPLAFQTRRYRRALEDAFVGDVVLVRKHEDWDEAVLPKCLQLVGTGCLLMQPQVSQMMFAADRAMNDVLDMKAETRGLSTNRLDGRNCHFLLPSGPRKVFGDCAAIGIDRSHELQPSGVLLAVVDVNLSVLCDEVATPLRLVDPTKLILPEGFA